MARRPEKAPRISLNKLAEFMTASIPRQRRIIRDQKFGGDFVEWPYVRTLPDIGARRVGKSRAGRLLDGVEHSQFPEPRT